MSKNQSKCQEQGKDIFLKIYTDINCRSHKESICTVSVSASSPVLLCGGWSGPVCGLSGSRLWGVSRSLRHFRLQSHTQPLMSAEQRRRGPINKACLIQPQPSSLPSSLCLREDTAAVTQTAVYPALWAAVRGIIHMLPCQYSQRERETKTLPESWERRRSKLNKVHVLFFTVWPNVNVCVSVCFQRSPNSCMMCHMQAIMWQCFFRAVPHNPHHTVIESAHCCRGFTGGRSLQILAKCIKGKAKSSKSDTVISGSRVFVQLFPLDSNLL